MCTSDDDDVGVVVIAIIIFLMILILFFIKFVGNRSEEEEEEVSDCLQLEWLEQHLGVRYYYSLNLPQKPKPPPPKRSGFLWYLRAELSRTSTDLPTTHDKFFDTSTENAHALIRL